MGSGLRGAHCDYFSSMTFLHPRLRLEGKGGKKSPRATASVPYRAYAGRRLVLAWGVDGAAAQEPHVNIETKR